MLLFFLHLDFHKHGRLFGVNGLRVVRKNGVETRLAAVVYIVKREGLGFQLAVIRPARFRDKDAQGIRFGPYAGQLCDEFSEIRYKTILSNCTLTKTA
jgi:hypothetical protein